MCLYCDDQKFRFTTTEIITLLPITDETKKVASDYQESLHRINGYSKYGAVMHGNLVIIMAGEEPSDYQDR